jgi:hypothetical protein
MVVLNFFSQDFADVEDNVDTELHEEDRNEACDGIPYDEVQAVEVAH